MDIFKECFQNFSRNAIIIGLGWSRKECTLKFKHLKFLRTTPGKPCLQCFSSVSPVQLVFTLKGLQKRCEARWNLIRSKLARTKSISVSSACLRIFPFIIIVVCFLLLAFLSFFALPHHCHSDGAPATKAFFSIPRHNFILFSLLLFHPPTQSVLKLCLWHTGNLHNCIHV